MHRILLTAVNVPRLTRATRTLMALTGGALLFISPLAWAALPEPVAKAMSDTGVPSNAVSVYVREVGRQQALVDHRATTPMNPASTMKILTTLVGLDVLKPSFTWKTTFLSNARIDNGVLTGPLYIKGSGDPKFVTEHLQSAITALRARGIREISGDVVLDRSRFANVTHDPSVFDGQPLRP